MLGVGWQGNNPGIGLQVAPSWTLYSVEMDWTSSHPGATAALASPSWTFGFPPNTIYLASFSSSPGIYTPSAAATVPANYWITAELPGSGGVGVITKLVYKGYGTNPFGSSNCTP